MIQNRKRWLAIGMLLALVSAIAVACTPGGASPSASPVAPTTVATQPTTQPVTTSATRDQIIIVGLARAPTSIDPADHRSRESETVIRNMFDGLITRDTGNGTHLELAESTRWLDEKTLEIKLRQGVTFHNGMPLTADDVVFSFERIINPNAIDFPEPHTSPRKGLIAPLESIEKLDEATVVMHFSGAWPPALQLLVHQQIVPKAYLEEVGVEEFLKNPVGTGPFTFASANGMDEFVLARYDGYWGGAPSLTPAEAACVPQVVFRVIPEASTRVAALIAGEVDIIQDVPPELAETLASNSDIQVQTAPGTRPAWMELNVNRAPFDDVRVRQALNYAVDKELIAQSIYNGRAEVLPGVLSPHNIFANKSLQPYSYDTARALELLGEAGWSDTDGDQTLDKDGSPFAFVIDTQETTRTLAEAVAGQLRAIGIDAAVRVWEYSVLQPQLLAGERQAYIGDWGDSAFDPVGHMEAKWHGYVPDEPYGRGNFSTYDNAEVNALIKAGETEADEATRHSIYDQAQQILYDEAPAVFLVLPEVIEASSARIENWQPAADGRVNLHDVCLK